MDEYAVPFEAEIEILKAYESDGGERRVVVYAADDLTDRQGDRFTRGLLEKAVEIAESGEMDLLETHKDVFPLGKSCGVAAVEQEDGRFVFAPEFVLDGKHPMAEVVWDALATEEGRKRVQASIGGVMRKGDFHYEIAKDGQRERVIDRAFLDHVALTRYARAMNTRTGILDAIEKSIDALERHIEPEVISVGEDGEERLSIVPGVPEGVPANSEAGGGEVVEKGCDDRESEKGGDDEGPPPSGKYEDVEKKLFGDPTRRKYPVNSPERARAALVYGSRHLLNTYSEEEAGKVWNRIVRLALEQGVLHKISPDSKLDAMLTEETKRMLRSHEASVEKALSAGAVPSADNMTMVVGGRDRPEDVQMCAECGAVMEGEPGKEQCPKCGGKTVVEKAVAEAESAVDSRNEQQEKHEQGRFYSTLGGVNMTDYQVFPVASAVVQGDQVMVPISEAQSIDVVWPELLDAKGLGVEIISKGGEEWNLLATEDAGDALAGLVDEIGKFYELAKTAGCESVEDFQSWVIEHLEKGDATDESDDEDDDEEKPEAADEDEEEDEGGVEEEGEEEEEEEEEEEDEDVEKDVTALAEFLHKSVTDDQIATLAKQVERLTETVAKLAGDEEVEKDDDDIDETRPTLFDVWDTDEDEDESDAGESDAEGDEGDEGDEGEEGEEAVEKDFSGHDRMVVQQRETGTVQIKSDVDVIQAARAAAEAGEDGLLAGLRALEQRRLES